MGTAPPLSFFVRGPDGLSLVLGPPFDAVAETKLDKVACSAAKFSPDGSKLAVTTADAVVVYDAETCKEVLRLPLSGAAATFFSPRGSFLQTFQKPTGQEKNLTLWDLKSGSIAFQLFQKTMSKSNWPAIQFSDDETLACRLVTNEVHFYDGRDFQKGIIDKLRLPGIAGVQLSHAPGSHVAAYVPEMKGQPASARIYKVTEVSQGEPVARRSFFKSSTAQLIWNKGSTGLLVLATSDVDKSNQSYYGETRLHFLTSNGKHEGAVPLNKEGPIHDVQWSPSGTEFIVVYGFMPAKAALFSAECRLIFDFGSGPYNTIRWNPHGRFICLAGFGNLPGDMAFWDRQTLKSLGSTKASMSVTSEWSADGRYFMTATTAPRLQVDNGIKFFKSNGSLYHEKRFEKLYQAEWRPAPAELYPDRPPSPSSSKAAEKKQDSKPAAKPAVYRPPNASNSAAVRAQLFGEEEKPSGGLSKSALKNQKRRANKQKAGASEPTKEA
ncbi:hypothetical protein R1flu_015671 [Riccia fluitans]|uniref:Eukaryotic translation initiation factor 2A n=1 Tax=Riccia fluitans TaxID=41844 RepID=A0ABD1YKH1_9MARC